MKLDRIILLALAISLGMGCLLILLPFLPAMLWAGILVYCLWPLYAGFRRYTRPSVAAFVITLVVAGIVLVPLVHLALLAAREAREIEPGSEGCSRTVCRRPRRFFSIFR